ncbi:GNAT family N-acetyltransferase [Nibrella viscosa]|uniref:GNAT family N-acetyltransferase n=1 Tax=Nibrella viscosa TaxID=1084524 RepID=A0ABP8L0Y1_9BACT
MTHILDNPIWHALITGNKPLAYGSGNARYLKRDVGIFAGLKTNSDSDLTDLHALMPPKSLIVLFTADELTIPTGWRVELTKPILQMVYQPQQAQLVKDIDLVRLRDQDIPAMLELTALTKPGPFLPRTIELGNYEGIFQDNKLVAMAGQRLQPDPYTEISAVCTHPDHTGKGYAARLVRSQIGHITAAAHIPFLHLDLDNTAARKLYEKLGFQTRRHIRVYVLEKEQP